MLELVLDGSAVRRAAWSGPECEVVMLGGEDGRRRLFVLNHSSEPRSVSSAEGAGCRDLFTGEEFAGEVPLDAYGVALLESATEGQ
jgi:hypothetical protein